MRRTHKIKYGGDSTISGIDDTFRTYCGITEGCSEDMERQFVDRHAPCTCKKCEISYQKEIQEHEKTV